MLKINTSNVSSGQAMPFKSSMLDWIQENALFQDTQLVNAISNGNLPISAAGTIISGCDETISGSVHTISAGYIFSSNVYQTDGGIITLGSGQVVVCNIVSSYTSGNDPVTFSNGNTYNVHQSIKIELSAGASGSGDFDFSSLAYLRGKWTNIPLNTGWVTPGTGFIRPQFRVDYLTQKVYLRGTAYYASGSNPIIGTLPTSVAYPEYNYLSPYYDPLNYWQLQQSGDIEVFSTGAMTTYVFDGVSYDIKI